MADEAELIANLALRPEADRPSLLGLVRAATAKLTAPSDRLEIQLPAEEATTDPDRTLKFAPGLFDAVISAPEPSPTQTTSRSIMAAIGSLVRHPSGEAYEAAYRLLKEVRTKAIVDDALERVARELAGRRAALAAFARRLVNEAPDVEPLKFGIALLGISGEARDESLLLEVGQAEEFTLYSAVALTNLLAEPEDALWRLAKSVHGWGRIATVDRLAGTSNPAITAWLLREGFRNDIMYEYLAYAAATRGEMSAALAEPEIDDDLLASVAEILSALVAGGPAESIEHYRDAPKASAAFLRHAAERTALKLNVLSSVLALRELVTGERADGLRKLAGWSPQAFLEIRTLAGTILQKETARQAVEAGLISEDRLDYFLASRLAPAFGIDPWPFHLDRQRLRVNEYWWQLMQTDSVERVEEVLALARRQLDLALVGSGPTRSIGFAPGFRDDTAVDIIVSELRRFPGRGADFIEVGLRGRTTRLRNMTINALEAWPRETWPEGCEILIRAAIEREPDDGLRDRLGRLLSGHPT